MKRLRLWSVLALASCAALLAGMASPAGAQTYPSRPISMIVPFAAGGNVDAVARWVCP